MQNDANLDRAPRRLPEWILPSSSSRSDGTTSLEDQREPTIEASLSTNATATHPHRRTSTESYALQTIFNLPSIHEQRNPFASAQPSSICASALVITPSRKRNASLMLPKKKKRCRVGLPVTSFQILRNSLCDPKCSIDRVQEILSNNVETDILLCCQDEYGCFVLDYVIKAVVQQLSLLESNNKLDGVKTCWLNKTSSQWAKDENEQAVLTSTLSRFELVLSKQVSLSATKKSQQLSPLISILSMSSTSFVKSTARRESKTRWILECAKCLHKIWPDSFKHTSKAMGDNCLHISLRQMGSNTDLIHFLIDKDDGNMVLQRNKAGDLPLHVACAHQVPIQILHLVIQKTSRALVLTAREEQKHCILGSANNSGWTSLDLELTKYLDGVHATKKSYGAHSIIDFGQNSMQTIRMMDLPLQQVPRWFRVNDSATPKDCIKHMFGIMMERMTRHVIAKDQKGADSHMEKILFPRIIMLLNASFRVSQKDSQTSFCRNELLSTTEILHRLSSLNTPCLEEGAKSVKDSIPLFLLEYFTWKFPEQIHQKDESGKYPLHHAVIIHSSLPNQLTVNRTLICSWYKWIEFLLCNFPDAIKSRDNRGRLPLHHFFSSLSLLCSEVKEQPESFLLNGITERNTLMGRCANLMIKSFPESLKVTDPTTGLLPCLQMATTGSLEDTYKILRASPDGLAIQSSMAL